MRKQAGMTLPSMLLFGLVGLLLLKAAFAVVPMYWDDKMLTTVLSKMQTSSATKDNNSARKLLGLIERRLDENNLSIPTDNAIIKANKSGLTLDWQYERRANWISNIDIVVRFNQQAEF